MPLIRLVSLLLTILCVVVAWVTLRANGVLLLATIFAAVLLWSCGVFTRGFWVADDVPGSLSRLDEMDR